MAKKTLKAPRREDTLSRDVIIDAAIKLLDASGEGGLTFRALSEKLATGPGAIYWHIANKDELIIAACDAIIVRILKTPPSNATPQAAIRAFALELFDAMDAHRWIGPALARTPGQLSGVRILERIGQQVHAMGVPERDQWVTVGTLLNYILGVGEQNASNGQMAREMGIDRTDFLTQLAATWAVMDADTYPFTRSIARYLPTHDDRADFLAGIDLILKGIAAKDAA